jgi:hypothetical protein
MWYLKRPMTLQEAWDNEILRVRLAEWGDGIFAQLHPSPPNRKSRPYYTTMQGPFSIQQAYDARDNRTDWLAYAAKPNETP